MGRPRTGSVYRHGDHWDIRLTLPGGERSKPACQPPSMTEQEARAKAREATARATAKVAVRITRTKPEKPAPGETLTDYAERWCVERERRGHTSVDDDRGRLRKWVLPWFNAEDEKPITEINKRDLEGFVENLDNRVIAEELHWKTARNVWGIVSKLFDDAVNAKSLSLRPLNEQSNPALGVRGPDDGPEKSKAYLYPSEFLALVSCAKIPVRWRRMYALAVYLYPRVAEVRALEWSDVDLDHAAVFIHRAVDESGKADSTKGRLPRRFAVEAELLPLLRALRADAGGLGNVFAPLPVEKHLAPMLRRDLERAGVTRIELFTGDQNRKRMTFHDLRATGITWMAIRGDEPLRIQHRAGHKQFGTTQGYIREAEQLRDGFGEVFPPLPADVVSSELAPERLGLNGHVYRGQPQTEPPPADRFVRSIVRAAR